MKLIFLNRFFFPDHSATSQMLSDLTFALAQRGHTITVITSRQRYEDPVSALPPNEIIDTVNIVRVATPRFGRTHTLGRLLDYLGFYLSASLALWRLADRHTLVVAKTDPPLISVPAALICRVRGARLINWLQDLFPEVATALGIPATRGLLGKFLMHLRNWSLRRAVCNVVIGERMRDLVRQQHVPDTRIHIIHNWADGNAIHPVAAPDNPLRHDWGLENKFVIGYSGNLGRAHEFETIMDAAKALRDQKDIIFLFIGGGAQASHAKRISQEHALDNVIFKPYQPREKLHLSLAVADVHLVVLRPELEGLIVPSKYYGIAAAGRPSIFIGDHEGEIARIIKQAKSGAIVQPRQSQQLTAVIKQLHESNQQYQLGHNARAAFDKQYDLPHAVVAWQQLISKCTEKSRSTFK